MFRQKKGRLNSLIRLRPIEICIAIGLMLSSAGFAGQEIFEDGFESGDLSAWSSFLPPLATTILSTSPLPTETAVALTRETIFVFEAPIDETSLGPASVRAETDGGMELPATLHISADGNKITLFYDPPLPAGTQIRAIVDGDLLKNANGQNVDANGNGHPGGKRILSFTTLGLESLPGTRVCGRVLASESTIDGSDIPLIGVTISIDGLGAAFSATTDSVGNYCLDPAPSDRFFVHIDGSTAGNAVPDGAYYPTVGKALEPKPGLTHYVGDSYLPLITAGTLQPVSTSEDTTILLPPSVLAERPELAGSELMVPAGSLFFDDGLPGTSAGLAPVPADRLPGNLPSDLDFPVVFTVQTDGAGNFDTPAPVCFPNLVQPATGEILPAGAFQSLVSFDHDAGRWRAVGGMTVDSAAERICSNPGVGIVAPGWHFPSPPPVDPPPAPVPPPPPGPHPPHEYPPPTPDPPTDPPEPPEDPGPCEEGLGGCMNRCQAVAASNACAYTMWGAGFACGLGTLTLNPVISLVGCGGVIGLGGIAACSQVNNMCTSACEAKCGGSAQWVLRESATGDPILDQLGNLSNQVTALIEPYGQSTAALPQEVRDQVAALLQQADQVAGGDAIAYLQAGAADGWPMVEQAMPSGNAPHYPILYLAEYQRGDETLTQRGETGPYGQYTLFPAPRASLIRIRFYDPHTHSVGMQFPIDLGGGSYGISRLYLGPVDDATFPDFDGDTLPDEIELIYGSNPTLSDTDGDGESDRDEIIAGTDPLGRDIEVGEVVADLLAVPGEIDRYTLAVMAGQKLFFDIQSGAGGGKDWSFLDPDGVAIFDTALLGDLGTIELARGGNYTLWLGDDAANATGPYQFQLWDVPAPDTFNISIGDPVSDGLPAAGAGRIETPGVLDIYSFSASPGQDVFFDIQAGAASGVDWRLVDEADNTIFDTFFGGDRGVITLTEGGSYTLTIGNPTNDHFGTYQFQLWDVPPPETFNISIGDIVADGLPAAGAGRIESPGVLDIYSFTADPGQDVFFDVQAGASSGIDWRLEDETGSTIFDTFFGGDRGVITLNEGGSYTLTIGSPTNDHFGTYQFQLWDVPPAQAFNIAIGDVVSQDVPAVGAGHIETPGVLDVYTFNAGPDQTVFFDIQDGASSGIDWRLTDDGDNVIFDTFFGGDRGGVTLVSAGTYTLTIGDPTNDHAGTYQFQLWNVPPADIFNIAIGTVISENFPGAGAGHIETPGVFDIYTFTAGVGQSVLFDIQSGATAAIKWRLENADGIVFDRRFSGDRTETLAGGTYTLTIGRESNDHIGTYQLALITQ